jgi:tetratricopeptide (TPR) repeat protein
MPEIRPHTLPENAASSPFDQAYMSGKAHFSANRVGLAIVHFERALAIDPVSVEALNAAGACYDDLRRYDIAMTFYKRALAVDPVNTDTLNNMGVSLMMAGQRDDATQALTKAASLNSEDPVIKANLVIAQGHPQSVTQTATQPKIEERRPNLERTGERTYALNIPARSAASATFKIDITPGEDMPAMRRDPVKVEPLPEVKTEIDIELLFAEFQQYQQHTPALIHGPNSEPAKVDGGAKALFVDFQRHLAEIKSGTKS